MKLRKLWLGGYRNLQDVAIDFPEPVSLAGIAPRPPVFLLLGVNGTGKTGILRALAHIFSQLEDRQAPGLAFELAYQIARGGRSFEVAVKGEGRRTEGGIDFAVTGEDGVENVIDSSQWTDYLPAQTVVYTSGHLGEWRFLLEQAADGVERREEERTELLHQQLQAKESVQEVSGVGDLLDFASIPPIMAELIPNRTALFTDDHLELALLATLAIEGDSDELQQQAEECHDIYRRAGVERLRAFSLDLEPLANHAQEGVILEQVDLLVRALLEDRLEEDAELRRRLQELLNWTSPVLPEQLTERVRQLAELAEHLHRNPDGSYHLLFEMDEETRLNLGGSQGLFGSAKQFFDFLADLQKRGVLARVDLILDKTDLAEPILSRHLSDGEREFLGRMALFLLMRQPESLFLLDEPETHFNDVWKRELVELLANVLEGRDSTVLLSTHSSIVISDVAHPQLVLLVKDEEGHTKMVNVRTPTLGADPSEIIVQVLGGEDSIGTNALEDLDELLEIDWAARDLAELESTIRMLGPGYHRSELRTIWRRLSATQD